MIPSPVVSIPPDLRSDSSDAPLQPGHEKPLRAYLRSGKSRSKTSVEVEIKAGSTGIQKQSRGERSRTALGNTDLKSSAADKGGAILSQRDTFCPWCHTLGDTPCSNPDSCPNRPTKVTMETAVAATVVPEPSPNRGVGIKVVNSNDGTTGDGNTGALSTPVESQSFASKVKARKEDSKINFRFIETASVEHADVVIPVDSVKRVREKFQNVLFGYFLGDRIAYPVVEYYVEKAWAKYGLVKTMMNANGFFFFKFDSKVGMEKVLTDGPWIIRSAPIFLNVWNPNVPLKKEDIKKVTIWVKMHDVPIVAYTDDGLSMIASKIGKPKLLDTHTATMCREAWGRSSYARALLEIDASSELKESLTVAIPNEEGNGFLSAIVTIEYEWVPPRCPTCCVFGHTKEACPKNATKKVKQGPKIDKEAFIEVTKKKSANGKNIGINSGVVIGKPKPKFQYRPVANAKEKIDEPTKMKVPKHPLDGEASKTGKEDVSGLKSNVVLSNPFDVLSGDLANDEPEDEGFVEPLDETAKFMVAGNVTGASTSTSGGSHV